MKINISLCSNGNSENLVLSDIEFLKLWQSYLNLPFERRLFTPKEVINAIDKKLEPNYNLKEENFDLLNVVKELEDICIMGLVNNDSICIRVER